ncbi:hypothetical protein [Streptosporangium sp. NPDC004631]
MYFLEQLPGHYRADMWLGPRHLIPTVTTQAHLIKELAQAADAPVRRGLLSAGVAYAALLGWLYQDAGDIHHSGVWRTLALDMAHRSQDPQLISYALTNKAMLAVDLEDGRTVVDYAEAALANESKLCPKVRILALVHQAHGHSMLPVKSKNVVDRFLDQAADLVDHVDDEHPWGNACRRTLGYIDVQRATAYLRLGAYREAVALWEQILGAARQRCVLGTSGKCSGCGPRTGASCPDRVSHRVYRRRHRIGEAAPRAQSHSATSDRLGRYHVRPGAD